MSECYYWTNLNEISQSINYPLQHTKRIKYSCFDISLKYIVFGATTGSIYVFHRKSCTFQKIIPSQFGPISQILISHHEKQIAMANQRGQIGVLDVEAVKPEIVTTQLEDTYVTCFCWTANDKELYCGDKRGIVSLLQFSYFMGRNLVHVTLNPILILDSQIVQISDHKDLLLVSTLSKCVLCNTAREEFKQIGNRPRDGQYGACFTNNTESDAKVFCSRPGSRLWEADLDGNVQKTHQFKSTLCKLSKIVIENSDFHRNDRQNDNNEKQSIIPFQRLHQILNKFLLIHDLHNIFIIDPNDSVILLWNNEIQNIHSIKILDNLVYIFTNNQKMFSVQINTIYEYATGLLQQEKFIECAHLIKNNLNYFCEASGSGRRKNQFSRLKYELDRLKMDSLMADVLPFLNVDGCSTNSDNIKRSSPTLENGIYILENLNLNPPTPDLGIKEALVSVVRGRYGKNIKQMVKGLQTNQNLFDEEDSHQKIQFLSTKYTEEDDFSLEDVVPIKIPPNAKFSASLLNDYQVNEDDKIVRNLFLIYKSSTISNLNFLDRYAKIFDNYEAKTIISFLIKLEEVMEENGEEKAKMKCFRIYFDYLKVELIWEVDDEAREYIKKGFIEMNSNPGDFVGEKCDACGFYLQANKTCHYLEIGTSLFQYYWSRKEYEVCFEVTKQVPFMWRTICKFYIQEKRTDKIVKFAWNLGSKELFEKAVSELYTTDLWRKMFDLMILLFIEKKIVCLNCDKSCTVNTETASCYSNTSFYSWDHILNVATKYFDTKSLLNLVLSYADQIPKGSIDKRFYINCLLNAN